MKHTIRTLLACVIFSGMTLFAQKPVKIIFDTDMGNDIDDALALALIHSLQNRKECELVAVTFTNPDPRAVPYTQALNAFYGRPGIPLGFTPDAPYVYETKYMQHIERKDAQGKPLLQSKMKAADAWDSVKLLRKTLAESADKEIVVIQVGFSTNLARLLDTKADEHSPLSGIELVKAKVKYLSVMGGWFPTDIGTKNGEFNIVNDIPAAQKLVAEWPVPIIWNGFEIGRAIRFDVRCIGDFDYVENHPIKVSYEMYSKMPYERPLWDLFSVLCVVWPDRDYFTLSEPGLVSISDDGRTTHNIGKSQRDRYLIVSPEQAIRLRELTSKLVSEPPQK